VVLGGACEHFDGLCLHGCRAGSGDLAAKGDTLVLQESVQSWDQALEHMLTLLRTPVVYMWERALFTFVRHPTPRHIPTMHCPRGGKHDLPLRSPELQC
jgi:hypothetical protein